ncbi:MAG: leucine-rich repeat domain-containing protein, partial [Bacteroidales bacterium]|nr:leucine-rich repeat domain-containing protein [Bacteroidales bacterium]
MMKKVLTFFAIIAMAMGISQSVKAQEHYYDGFLDTLGNRLYYQITDTNTAVICSPTDIWSQEEGEDRYTWKRWKGYTQPSGFVLIPDSITTWNGLVLDTLPVVAIWYRAFMYCNDITEVTFPPTLTTIEEGAFESCHGLVTANMPNSVTSLGNAAFYNCIKLQNCHISEGLTRIPNYAFMNDSSMRTLIIHENITSVGESAFSGLGTLDSLFYMPNTRADIGVYAFSYTPTVYLYTNTDSYMGALDVIELGDAIDTLSWVAGGRYLNNEGVEEGPGDLRPHLKKIIVGSGVKHIKKSAFMHVD